MGAVPAVPPLKLELSPIIFSSPLREDAVKTQAALGNPGDLCHNKLVSVLKQTK